MILNKINTMWDYLKDYLPFVVRHDIRFSNWKHHMEMIDDPDMYLISGFEPKRLIFDIGSQYGDWAIMWSKKFNVEVWAFEPLTDNINEMAEDLYLNKLTMKVHAVKTLVGDGTSMDYIVKENMASFSWTNHPKHHPTMRIDDFVLKWNKYPDLIKIDVEGFEYQVLKGSEMTIDTYHPRIIIETHSSELREKCDGFLRTLDYELIHKGREIKGSGWMDEVVNLFYAYRGI